MSEHDVDCHRLGWAMITGPCEKHGRTTWVWIKSRWLCIECDFEAWLKAHYG